MPSVNKSILEQIKVCIPRSIYEQQKIADCLASLDELIAAHSDKLDTLKTHKQGLLQKLFPRDGETVPKLRFSEFINDGLWAEAKLDEYLVKNPEYGVSASAVPYDPNLPTYLRITDISEDGNFKKVGRTSLDVDFNNDKYLNEGDIVLARTGASVGKAYMYRPEDGPLVFAGFLIRVVPNPASLSSGFLFQFLFSGRYWRWVESGSARSGQPGLNSRQYAEMPIPLPPTFEEQQKIADCLFALDDRITAQADKIEALKEHKKGLLQQLFPNME